MKRLICVLGVVYFLWPASLLADVFCYYWVDPDGTVTSYKTSPIDLSTPPNGLRKEGREGHLIIGTTNTKCSDGKVLTKDNTVTTRAGGRTGSGGGFSVVGSSYAPSTSYATPSRSSSSSSSSGSGSVRVKAYTRKDGTRVRSYTRSRPKR